MRVLCTRNPPQGFFNTKRPSSADLNDKLMKFGDYIKATQAEMTHVNWPTRQQTIRFTVLVILVSLATAALLGVSDFVFSKLLTLLF